MNEMIGMDAELAGLYSGSELDTRIIEGALNLDAGQSDYQSRVFVANSAITQYRSIKQCLLELETRHHSWNDINTKRKRKIIEIKMAKRDIETFDDELDKELLQVDIESMEYDVNVWGKKIIQSNKEISYFLNLIKELANGDDEMLEKAFTYDEDEERKYWISRMAKQAAMDMVSYGRIGAGNMDSIAMMPEEDQMLALATTLQYNERLSQGMTRISEAVSQGLLENSEGLPEFNVPHITDKLLASEKLQHTPKPKTKPESV
jgi:hypothetical protein